MDSSLRFPPISSERSTRLKLVVAYFALTGAALLVVLLLGLVQAALGNAELRELFREAPLNLLLAAAMAGLFLLLAWQIHHRSRRAAVVAAILLGLPIAGLLLNQEGTVRELVLSVIGLAFIVSIRDELRRT